MKTLFATAAISFCLFLTSPVSAQFGVRVGANGPTLTGFGDVDIEKTVEKWAERETLIATQDLDLEIDQLAVFCELDEDETKKLRIVAKGIVSSRIESGSVQLQQFAVDSGLIEEDDVELNEDFEVDEQDELTFYGAAEPVDGAVQLASFFEAPTTENPRWTQTLESTLSAEQFDKYKEFVLSRNKGLLNAAIDAWVADIDSKVFLSAEQAANIKASLKETYEPDVTLAFPTTINSARRMLYKDLESSDSLGDMLNEAQTARRQTLRQPPLNGGSCTWGGQPDR